VSALAGAKSAPISGFSGVTKVVNKWVVFLEVDGRQHNIGAFDSRVAAKIVYEQAMKSYLADGTAGGGKKKRKTKKGGEKKKGKTKENGRWADVQKGQKMQLQAGAHVTFVCELNANSVTVRLGDSSTMNVAKGQCFFMS
jgi:hypothetical protein